MGRREAVDQRFDRIVAGTQGKRNRDFGRCNRVVKSLVVVEEIDAEMGGDGGQSVIAEVEKFLGKLLSAPVAVVHLVESVDGANTDQH